MILASEVEMAILTAPPAIYQTKQAIAYNHLRAQILSGSVEPGQRLVIDGIARDLQISPIPVREAIKQLEAERLILFTPHSGAVVAEPPDAEEVFVLLESLEQIVASAAAIKADGADCAKLELLLAELDSARESGDLGAWLRANTSFHEALARIAEMPLAADLLSRANREWERLRLLTPSRRGRIDLSAADKDHAAMIDCLRRHDAERLCQLIRAHLAAARAHFAGARRTKRR
jgi:DNA-binding GntR family transcriptional regulator